ncbi:MAG: tRNA (adenosine(37)-N6)-threonylcarbamoyltransferase complex ATPase subunit type 1 TsaE [Chloroflexi bacterium]|nr:tRNA (adenosine(37)-N6)-threonylcarbamoyltransferase complex ATPase subunit type 1 TsaE [Chloroflexota bacterium]
MIILLIKTFKKASKIKNTEQIDFISNSPEFTQSVGKIIGKLAVKKTVLLLNGDLGSGKTCFTQGILQGLDSDEYARSPTFVLKIHYSAKINVQHIDLYRLNSESEIIELDLEEDFNGDNVTIIEWANKIKYSYPYENITVNFNYKDENSREINITSTGSKNMKIITKLKSLLNSK